MLLEGEERAKDKIKQEREKIATLTVEAIKENQHLSQSSFAKGFHSKKWQEAQREWIRRLPKSKRNTIEKWSRDLIIATHTYSYEMWKSRNAVAHGENQQEGKQIKQKRVNSRVEELYRMSRKELDHKDKKYSNSLLHIVSKLAIAPNSNG